MSSPELSRALRSPPGLCYAARRSSQTGYGSGYSQLVMTANCQTIRGGGCASRGSHGAQSCN
eukprot:11633079-Alexandrium_andersonii.AAC.1